MKHALLFAAAAAGALSLATCQRREAAPTPNPAEPGTSNTAVNAAQDTTSAAVGAVSANLGSLSTDQFVTNAGISDLYEIQAGQVAQRKGQSQDVKAFGKMMVTDHTAMSNEMKPLMTSAGKTPPVGLDERRKGMVDNLNAAPAGEFDKTYLNQQETAHREALDLMKGYADRGDNAQLKAAAAKAVPKIQAHLDRVRELQSAPPSAGDAKK